MENQSKLPPNNYGLILVSILLLVLVYVFQRTDYLSSILHLFSREFSATPNIIFVFNKTLRLILNDILCILLIYGLFGERKYLKIAFIVFCFELLIILPVYLIIKLSVEGTSEISSPLLSQVHRLIVNPMLMLVLIAGFYYQRNRSGSSKT